VRHANDVLSRVPPAPPSEVDAPQLLVHTLVSTAALVHCPGGGGGDDLRQGPAASFRAALAATIAAWAATSAVS
jgi:hypothetical protein